MQQRSIHYFIIALLAVISYLPTFTGDFILDDKKLVKDNPYIRELHSLSSYLAQEDGIVDQKDLGVYHTYYWRPLVNVTYFLDYKVWGLNAAGFRTINLFLHLMVCLILYGLILQLTGSDAGAFWGTLLFAVHPVQTETVSVIVSRNNLLSVLFILGSLYSYIYWWSRRSNIALAASLTMFIGAVFSKESGLILPLLLILYHRFIAGGKMVRRELEGYVPYVVITAFYFCLRMMAIPAPNFNLMDALTRMYFIPYIFCYHLKLIFLPFGLHSIIVQNPLSFSDFYAILSIVIVFVLGMVLYLSRNAKLLTFSSLCCIITLLPILSPVIKASVSLVSMRWLYGTMAFVSMGAAYFFSGIPRERKAFVFIVSLVLIAYFMAYSYILNRYLWHDNKTFLKQEILQFKNGYYMGEYAEKLSERKDDRQAEKYFLKAINKYPLLAKNYINYSALLVNTGRPAAAVGILDRAKSLIMIHSERIEWNNNMGVAGTMLGEYRQALDHFKRALVLEPGNVPVKRNMAILLRKSGQASVEGNPDD